MALATCVLASPRTPRRGLWAAAAAGLNVLCACSSSPSLSVVAVDGPLCDLSRQLVPADLRVTCLLNPGDDPHQLQLKPDQQRHLSQASLTLTNGFGLTPALEKHPQAIRVAEQAFPHHSGDPHLWHDPRQAAAMAAVVSRELQRLSPSHARAIQQREQAMASSLLALDAWNQRQFATLPPGTALATSHNGFRSLSKAYGLTAIALIDDHSSSEHLHPQDLRQTLHQLEGHTVKRLFSEQQPASRALQRLSQLSRIPLAEEPLMADAATSDLMASLSNNTCLIVESLGGQCDRPGQRELMARWHAIPVAKS